MSLIIHAAQHSPNHHEGEKLYQRQIMMICGLGYVEELKMLVETFIGGLSCVKQVLMLIVQG